MSTSPSDDPTSAPVAEEAAAPSRPLVEEAAAPTRARRRPALIALAVTFVVAYLTDLITKVLAVRHLDPANPPEFLGGLLKLKLIRNPGAAFSMGTSVTELLSVLTIVALLACAIWLAPRARGAAQGFVLGLGMAGIAGNLTDRLFRAPGPLRGHVVDFFSVPNFAIFNVADICLTTAAGLVIVGSLLEGWREKKADQAASDEATDPAPGR